jgi:hypothetical protein
MICAEITRTVGAMSALEFCTGSCEVKCEAEESPLVKAECQGIAGGDTAGRKRLSLCCGDL